MPSISVCVCARVCHQTRTNTQIELEAFQSHSERVEVWSQQSRLWNFILQVLLVCRLININIPDQGEVRHRALRRRRWTAPNVSAYLVFLFCKTSTNSSKPLRPTCLPIPAASPSHRSTQVYQLCRYLHLLVSASALLSPTLVASESCLSRGGRLQTMRQCRRPGSLSLSLSQRRWSFQGFCG